MSVLLIGNAAYRKGAVLRNPEKDVKLLGDAFKARGAQVNVLVNLTAQQLETAIPEFLQAAGARARTLWIGYSGHAVQINGRNYLQGIDSDFATPERVREFGLDLDRVLAQVERKRPTAAVVSIDACRNNPFEPERTRGILSGLAAQEPRGLCVSFSTAPYMKALDGETGQYSPYARALAAALAGGQRKMLDSVLRETANSVYRSTGQRQIPEYRSALRGEWWFDAGGVQLLGGGERVHADATSTGPMREVSYRPDEPQLPARYVHTDGAYWSRVERQMLLKLRRTGVDQARAVVQRANSTTASDEDRIMASMLLQDGLSGVARSSERARKSILPVANEGNAFAQTLLGESFYLDGSFDQAYKWLSIAARTGYGRALTDMGQMETEGLTAAEPQAGAIKLLEGMVRQGREAMSPPGASTPSADMLDAARRLQDLLGSGRR